MAMNKRMICNFLFLNTDANGQKFYLLKCDITVHNKVKCVSKITIKKISYK